MLAAVFTASATVTWHIGSGETPDATHYTSLYDASIALKNHTWTDDMVWLITSDLTETLNCGIHNASAYSFTIRPDADADRTITFETPKDNYGPSGNFVIGGVSENTDADDESNNNNIFDNDDNIRWACATTRNLTIDGYAEGATTRRLKIVGGSVGGTAILIYGDVATTTIKNCIVESNRASGTGYDITVRAENKNAIPNTDQHPVGIVIDNCHLVSTLSSSGQGVYFNSKQRSTDAGLVENTIIRNCEIEVKHRAIFIEGLSNLDVTNCVISVIQQAGGMPSFGIQGNNSVRGTINIKNNHFTDLKSVGYSTDADYGIVGIGASYGNAQTVWKIENNIFSGLDALPSSYKYCRLCAIRCGDSCVIRHNTFVMPTLSRNPSSTALTSSYPISLLYLAGSKHYIVENNIFVSHEKVANNSLIRTGAPMDKVKHNVFYHDGGSAYITASASSCQDMTAYNTAYPDAASTWKEAKFNADMSLAEASIGDFDLAVAKLNDITTDINGEDRHDPTYAGAEAPGYLVGQVYEFNTQMGDWDLTQGSAMTKIANNVFRGTYIFGGGDRYVSFSQNVSSTASGWDEAGGVNEGRISVLSNGDFVVDGNSAQGTIQMGQGGNSHSFKIPQANGGTFEFTLNFNTMKVDIIKSRVNNLYAFNDASGDWNFGAGTTVTKVSANVFEGEYTLPEDAHLLFATANADNWTDINAAQLHINAGGDYWVNGDSEATLSGDANNSFWIKAAGKYKFNINLNTNKVTITQLNATLDVTDAGYATYYNSTKAYTMPDGMTGYAFNVANGLVEAYTEGQVVPADMPLVLEAPQGNYALEFTTGGTPVDLASQLHGSDAEAPTSSLVSGSHVFYGLSLAQGNDPATVGFYYMADGGAAFNNGAHKAFLAVPTGSEAPERILFINNDATNINNIEGQEQAVKFIQNGQMFIKKNGVTYDALGRVVR